MLDIIDVSRVGVPAQAYLTSALERLGTHRDVLALPLEALTPAALKLTLGRHAFARTISRAGSAW